MTPRTFIEWLADMKSAGLAHSDAEAGRMLGLSPDTMVRYKRNGAPLVVALACRALLHRMAPYGGKNA